MKLKYFGFLTLLLILALLIRIIIYNRYIFRLNNNIEQFSDLNNSNSNSDQSLLINDIIKKPNIIFNNIIGYFYFISGNDCVIKDDKDNKRLTTLDKLFNTKKIYAESGFYDYKNNCIIVITADLVYTLCFKTHSLLDTQKIKDYFKLSDNSKINSVLEYNNEKFIFINNKILKINTNGLSSEINKSDYFGNLPKKITCSFINFLDIEKGVPFGTPTFICDSNYFTYSKNKLRGPIPINEGFINNVKIYPFLKSKTNFKLKSGDYRIYLCGAGIKNGGFGGLIYNDVYLNKNHNISIICGLSGERIPVKGKESLNKLKEVYSLKLPYNSSCSGSGGTFLFLNDKTVMCAAGGGGWSSELVKAPNFCHSQFKLIKPHPIVVIKKIVINTQKSKENRYALKIRKFNIKNYNCLNLTYNISCLPSKHLNNDEKSITNLETDYCDLGSEARIEITFSEPISDYSLEIDYDILSTGSEEYINSRMILIDEQYRKKIIDNYNYTFNYKYITPKTLSKYLAISCSENKDFNGNNKNFKDLDLNKPYHMILDGGEGGGGSLILDKNKQQVICCGGGGHKGGVAQVNDNKNNEYTGGSGGVSFIKTYSFGKVSYDSVFVNDFNDSSGYAVIHKINKKTDLPEIDKKMSENSNNNANNSLNSFRFFNKNVEQFFDTINLDKPHIGYNENKSDDFFQINETKKSRNNLNCIFEIDLHKKKNTNNLVIDLRSTIPFNVYTVGLDNKYNRTILNKQNNLFLTDNIATMNHGLSSINRSKMEKYLKFLLENDIYKHINYLSWKDLKKNINVKGIHKLSSLVETRSFSVKQNNESIYSQQYNLNSYNFDKIYLVVESQNSDSEITINNSFYNSKKIKLENNRFYQN